MHLVLRCANNLNIGEFGAGPAVAGAGQEIRKIARLVILDLQLRSAEPQMREMQGCRDGGIVASIQRVDMCHHHCLCCPHGHLFGHSLVPYLSKTQSRRGLLPNIPSPIESSCPVLKPGRDFLCIRAMGRGRLAGCVNRCAIQPERQGWNSEAIIKIMDEISRCDLV